MVVVCFGFFVCLFWFFLHLFVLGFGLFLVLFGFFDTHTHTHPNGSYLGLNHRLLGSKPVSLISRPSSALRRGGGGEDLERRSGGPRQEVMSSLRHWDILVWGGGLRKLSGGWIESQL